MATHYSDRDYDRLGRRSGYGYSGSYGDTARRYRSNEFDRDYGIGGRFRDYGRDYDRERDYELGDYDRYDSPYNVPFGLSSERYNYPSEYRSNEIYGSGYRRGSDYDRDYLRNRALEERNWWDRASDEVSSWFGDEEAERRRRMDERRGQHRGRGPRGYQRSDTRITEDINDRLTDDPYLDASDIEVKVNNREVILTGTVRSRSDKRRAEGIVEAISGVTDVQNNLRINREEASASTSSSMSPPEKAGTGRARSVGT
jgi:osmotically-inducible protein OsmY